MSGSPTPLGLGSSPNRQLYSIKNEAVLALGQLEISDEATHVIISIDAHQIAVDDSVKVDLSSRIIRQDRTRSSLSDMEYGSVIRDPTFTRYDIAIAVNQLVKALARGERALTMGEIVAEIERGGWAMKYQPTHVMRLVRTVHRVTVSDYAPWRNSSTTLPSIKSSAQTLP